MGSDFSFTCVPQCEFTAERKQKLLAIAAECEAKAEADDDCDEVDLVAAVEAYDSFENSRHVGTIILPPAVPHFITGGLSWGDFPTEDFQSMDALVACQELYNELEKFAIEDRRELKRQKKKGKKT